MDAGSDRRLHDIFCGLCRCCENHTTVHRLTIIGPSSILYILTQKEDEMTIDSVTDLIVIVACGFTLFQMGRCYEILVEMRKSNEEHQRKMDEISIPKLGY